MKLLTLALACVVGCNSEPFTPFGSHVGADGGLDGGPASLHPHGDDGGGSSGSGGASSGFGGAGGGGASDRGVGGVGDDGGEGLTNGGVGGAEDGGVAGAHTDDGGDGRESGVPQGDDAGCELVTHDNGLEQTWQDCTPLGTYDVYQATKACEAWCDAVGCLGLNPGKPCWTSPACTLVNAVFGQLGSGSDALVMAWSVEDERVIQVDGGSCLQMSAWE